MAYSDAALSAAVRAIAGLADRASIHTGDPGLDGAGEIILAGRQTVSFGNAAGGQVHFDRALQFIVPAHTHVGGWAMWGRDGTLLIAERIDPGEDFVREGRFELDTFLTITDRVAKLPKAV